MNIKHLLSAAATLMVLAACSEYDPGFSKEDISDYTEEEIKTLSEFTDNFVNRYCSDGGEMDPNHKWGFGDLATMGTRAVQVDRNNWAVPIVENNQVVGVTTTVGTTFLDQSANPPQYNYEYTSKEGYIVPGFPSKVDDMYYIEENNASVAYTEDQIKAKMQYNQVQPVGDVTDEEIEYVSWWFRNHPKITSVTPPFTEYFIQDISQDYDRVTYPDGDWIDYGNGGRQVPTYYHMNDGTVRQENPSAINYGMDYFSVKTHESDGSDFWEHNNNLNKGKANPIAQSGGASDATATDTTALVNSDTRYSNRTLKYWTSEGVAQNAQTGQSLYKDGTGYTTSFSFHNSNDNKDYQNYVLVHLQFYGPRTGKWYDGYYLGFDYELHKNEPVNFGQDGYKTTDVERDSVYSNWIVKLAPGNPEFYGKTETFERRVMCEDLGTTYDFDFNDLVFDVKYTREMEKDANGDWQPVSDEWDATITIQAAGGTLPIYIENFDGTEYNVHEYMGGTTSGDETWVYKPINVGMELTLPAKSLPTCKVTSTNPDDIKIFVYSKDEERSATKKVELPDEKGRQKFGTNLAPQKICMPVDVRWTREYQQIEWAYPYFAEWVQSENGAAGFGNDHDWTRTGITYYHNGNPTLY